MTRDWPARGDGCTAVFLLSTKLLRRANEFQSRPIGGPVQAAIGAPLAEVAA
jgi:hypothetical protein